MSVADDLGQDQGVPLSFGSLLRTPSDVVSAVRSVLGWTDEAVQVVADLPARVAALMDEAERLVAGWTTCWTGWTPSSGASRVLEPRPGGRRACSWAGRRTGRSAERAQGGQHAGDA